MQDQYEFNEKYDINEIDNLEHYRIQIKKLKELNIQQQQGYQKKIQSLQKMLKQQGFGSVQSNKNYVNTYQTGSTINTQIMKRDKQINRLSEQNDRLKKQYNSNPDRELLHKRRNYFDEVADKDAQIIRLKKTIYELQSKYNGKYFNQTKIKNQYDLLFKENQQLKQSINSHYYHFKNNQEVNNQVLEGIKYKKQYDVIIMENQQLKNQLKKVNHQYYCYKQQNIGRQTYQNNNAEGWRNNQDLARMENGISTPQIIISPPEMHSNSKNLQTLSNSNMKPIPRKKIFNKQVSNTNNDINNSHQQYHQQNHQQYHQQYHQQNHQQNGQQYQQNGNTYPSQQFQQDQQPGQNMPYHSQIKNQTNNYNPTPQQKQPFQLNPNQHIKRQSHQNSQMRQQQGSNSIENDEKGFQQNGDGIMLNKQQKQHLKLFQQQPPGSSKSFPDQQEMNSKSEINVGGNNQNKSEIPIQMNSGISLPGTEKKRISYYDQFNIGEVTKNVKRQRPESTIVAPSQQYQLAQ